MIVNGAYPSTSPRVRVNRPRRAPSGAEAVRADR